MKHTQVSFPEGYGADDLMSLAFVDAAQDFVFHGQTGRGKNHLAIAVVNARVQASRAVRFFTTARLVSCSSRQTGTMRSRRFRRFWPGPTFSSSSSSAMCRWTSGAGSAVPGMSECCEERSVIVTADIEFSKWGTVLGSDNLAAPRLTASPTTEGWSSSTARAGGWTPR